MKINKQQFKDFEIMFKQSENIKDLKILIFQYLKKHNEDLKNEKL